MIPNRDIRHRAPVPPPPLPAAPPAAAIAIAPAAWRELRAVAALQNRAFRSTLAYGLSTLVVLRLLPQVRFLVARRGGIVVGCAIGDRHAGQTRVINLAVDPAVRRQGIGAALLAALEAALPAGDVILMVEADNPAAQALYRRAGYLPVGHSADYYGRGRAGIWMQKSRTPPGAAPSRPPALRL